MMKNEDHNMFGMDEQDEILAAQDRIIYKVRRINNLALLDKLEDFISRIYRRGQRR